MVWQIYGWAYLVLGTLAVAASGLPRKAQPARPSSPANVVGAILGAGLTALPVGGHLVGWW